mmetsp:Transcript_22119/g.61527  ORF Transcript_22119/g.61527 Transcript_22119/m.61527 type:complete len:185 (+) Transcript_22119:437-991(+)
MNERINSFFQSPFWASVFGQEPHRVDRCRSVRPRAKADTTPRRTTGILRNFRRHFLYHGRSSLSKTTQPARRETKQAIEQDKEKQLQTRIGLDWVGLVSSKLCTYERAFTITVCIRTQCYVMAFIDLFPILFLVVPFRSAQNKTQHNKTTRNNTKQHKERTSDCLAGSLDHRFRSPERVDTTMG